VTLAAAAAAFGSVYPWAYAPLLLSTAVLGGIGLLFGRGPLPGALLAALVLLVAAAGSQLVPLDTGIITALSPAALEVHRQRDLTAAVGARGSFPLSIDPQRTVLGLTFLAVLCSLLVGTARMLSRDSARLLAAGLAVVGVALAMLGIVQAATFNGRIYGVWPLIQGGAPFGPFINRNHFAGWVLMVLPLTIGLFASNVSSGMAGVRREWRSRLLWFSTTSANKAILAGFAVLVMTLALALTLSRSGISAMAGAMVFASWMMMRRHADRTRRYVVPVYLASVAIMAVLWAGVDRIASRFVAAGTLDIDGRRAIWLDTWRMIGDFWLTGTGLNTFGTAALYYQTLLKGSHMREAHNDYLQLAAEGGLLTGVPALAVVVILTVGIRRRLRNDVGSIWWIRVGAVSGLLAVAAQSVVEFSLQMPANAALFAVMCGIALHDGGVAVKPPVNHSPADRESRVADSNNVVAFGTPDPGLRFPIDHRAPDGSTSRRDIDPSELDEGLPSEPSWSPRGRASGRLQQRPPLHDRGTLGTVAALGLLVFLLLLLSL
jgi:hypothetical protein